jgi:hypothetical protein
VKKRVFSCTARPLPSCLAHPYEAERLKGKSVTVTMECTAMGRRNRDKIGSLAMDKCLEEFSPLCKIGGYLVGEPKQVAS